MPVHPVPNRSFAAGTPSQAPEHPVLKAKRSYEGPAVEWPVMDGAVVQTVGRD